MVAQDVQALYKELERIASATRTQPNRVALQPAQATEAMPTSMEAERLVVQRVGQDLFRAAERVQWPHQTLIRQVALARARASSTMVSQHQHRPIRVRAGR